MGWKEKSERAKKLHRPSLKDWSRDGLHATFPRYADSILSPVTTTTTTTTTCPYQSFRIDERGQVVQRCLSLMEARRSKCRNDDSNDDNVDNNVNDDSGDSMYPVVLDARNTPPKEFHERYEAHFIPAVIRNIPYGAHSLPNDHDNNNDDDNDNDDDDDGECAEERKEYDPNTSPESHGLGAAWPAVHRWDLRALSADAELRERPLKCGEDDDGYTIRLKLKHFLRYLFENTDDSPLYVFDATFDEDRYAKRLLQDYTVPRYFDEDLFGLVGERRRPPYRWFLVGPCRSGTTVHIDPLGTSAWNTLLHGVKRWVLFPPHVPKHVVKGRKLLLPGEDDEAIHYFCFLLPRMKRRAAASRGNDDYANFQCYEFTQYAGETVFVPHGWWHAVLNVTHTVGITQNFCSRRNFDVVWTQTRSGRKKMACSWLRRLRDHYPDLAKRAKELNRRDGFVMWEDDEKEQKKWRKKRAEKERKKREKHRDKQVKKKEEQQHQAKCHNTTEPLKKNDYHNNRHDPNNNNTQIGLDKIPEKNPMSLQSLFTYGSFGRETKRSRHENMREVSPTLSPNSSSSPDLD